MKLFASYLRTKDMKKILIWTVCIAGIVIVLELLPSPTVLSPPAGNTESERAAKNAAIKAIHQPPTTTPAGPAVYSTAPRPF